MPARRRPAWRSSRWRRTWCRGGRRRRSRRRWPAGPATISARSAQSSSDSGMGGRSPVRRPSATTTSSSASNGAMPRARATSPTVRPSSVGVLGGERLLEDQAVPHGQVPQDPGLVGLRPGVEPPPGARGPTAPPCARSDGSANTSRQPGRPSRMAPCSKLSRSCMVWGSVSATTVAPRSAAARAGGQLAPGAVGVHGRDAEHVPVDGPVGQQRHRRQEVDLVLGEAVEAAGAR